MFNRFHSKTNTATYKVVESCLAVLECNADGTIVGANEIFAKLSGYTRTQLLGKNHKALIPSASEEERSRFWEQLQSGQIQTGEYCRISRDGTPFWLRATYAPIKDQSGTVSRIVMFGLDTSSTKQDALGNDAILQAIDRVMAVIHFTPDGDIISANSNFIAAMGYTSSKEIIGKHHSIFVEKSEAASSEYKSFWQSLRAGQFHAKRFRRIGQNSREVWIEASYNPIRNQSGTVERIVKFATDITASVQAANSEKEDKKRSVERDFSLIAEALTTVSLQSATATDASVDTADNVKAVAAAVEELAASSKEIGQNVGQAASVAKLAVEQGHRANVLVGSLSEAAIKIGNMTGLVSNIANQTNLLALNATIEAARAGEAGKGFAVVAAEVKELANQSRKATDEIGAQISSAQCAISEMIETLREVLGTIDEIGNVTTNIASTVEQQGNVTQEIASNMQFASDRVTNISENIRKIAEATKKATDTANRMKATSIMAVGAA